jgi:hypothetical protein
MLLVLCLLLLLLPVLQGTPARPFLRGSHFE